MEGLKDAKELVLVEKLFQYQEKRWTTYSFTNIDLHLVVSLSMVNRTRRRVSCVAVDKVI